MLLRSLLVKLILVVFITVSGCLDDFNSDENSQKNETIENLKEKDFNLDEALKNKDFKEFYILMARTTHNIEEFDDSNPSKYRIMYTKADIGQIKRLLPSIPDNALTKSFAFREGMSSTAFTIADFIVRRANGSEDEKIGLLKDLVKRECSLNMLYTDYLPKVFYPKEGEDHGQDAKDYIDLLKKEPKKYGKIIAYIKTTH